MIFPARPTAVIVLLCVGLCLIVVGALPSGTHPPASLTSSYMVHPVLRVVNITGQPVGGAEVTLYTLNPTSRLASIAIANPSTDLVQDLNFTTSDLLIGSTVNDTVSIGPKDGNLVLTSMYTDQDGFARFNITAGICLVNVIKIYTGYSNVISHLRIGWVETLKMKPEKNPNSEPNGPYEYAIGAAPSAGNVTDLRPTYLTFGILFVTAAIILKMTSRQGPMDRNDSAGLPRVEEADPPSHQEEAHTDRSVRPPSNRTGIGWRSLQFLHKPLPLRVYQAEA